MAEFWLGDFQLDRWVFRTLRTRISANTKQLTIAVRRKLKDEGVVRPLQALPDENDVWCSLQRLTLSRHVDKYVNEKRGRDIRYRINARK